MSLSRIQPSPRFWETVIGVEDDEDEDPLSEDVEDDPEDGVESAEEAEPNRL